MALKEFEIIARYFTRPAARHDVVVGVGDDCAVVRPPPGMDIALTVDALTEGVHFPIGTDPEALGHKALAVNLSDLAAAGAEPAWATLALSLPHSEAAWLDAFARGLFTLAERYNVQVIGGDTIRGPLTVSIQLQGLVPAGMALLRSGAAPGDLIYVTGSLGDAGLGLAIALGRQSVPPPHRAALLARLERPTPRVPEGLLLRGLASAAIDISDGLCADLGHILERSGVGARIEVERLPLSTACIAGLSDADARYRLALTAGDDYELCFTVPPERRQRLEALFAGSACPVTCIGSVEAAPGLRLEYRGAPYGLPQKGYQHFGGPDGQP